MPKLPRIAEPEPPESPPADGWPSALRWAAPDGSHLCLFVIEVDSRGGPVPFACRRCGRSVLNVVADLALAVEELKHAAR